VSDELVGHGPSAPSGGRRIVCRCPVANIVSTEFVSAIFAVSPEYAVLDVTVRNCLREVPMEWKGWADI